MSEDDTTKFEEKCMDIIEQIVKGKASRQKAIALSKEILISKKANSDAYPEKIEVYERVAKEFEVCTNEEYNMLRKQILS